MGFKAKSTKLLPKFCITADTLLSMKLSFFVQYFGSYEKASKGLGVPNRTFRGWKSGTNWPRRNMMRMLDAAYLELFNQYKRKLTNEQHQG